MIHAAAPHFLWPFTVQYAAHQINLQPRVSLPETTPTLRWIGKVGDASVFHVWGSRALVRDTSADKLSSHAVPCAPGPSAPATATAANATAATATTDTAATTAATSTPACCTTMAGLGFSRSIMRADRFSLTPETSAVAVGAARGTPRPPFFEGCSPFPLAPSYASAPAADVLVTEDVGAAFASVKRRTSKGKCGRGGGGGSGSGGGGSSGGGGGGGTGGGSGGSGGGSGDSGGSDGSGGGGTGGGRTAPPSPLSLHLFRSDWLIPPGVRSLPVPPVTGGSVRLTVMSSHPLVLNELGEYRCPLGSDGHYHHSWGSLPPLPPSRAPPCLPCVEGWQRAAPHSSSFPPTTAPLQTFHMDVWGPSRVSGQGGLRYFLLVVDDYTRYTTVFPLHSKGEVIDVLIPWIRIVRLQLRERFCQDLPVLRLHSDRGGEFSSDLLRDFCRGEGITQSFTLPDSPQQNGIAERCIGLVMEVAHTSMIHAAAPHFLWPFAFWYPAHQLNLWPRVSLPKTSPTLRWMGQVGNAAVFRVWGSRAFVRDTSTDKLSARAIPCGPAPLGVSQLDPLPGATPVEVVAVSGAARGATSGVAEPGGAEPGGAESEGAGSGGAEPGGAEPEGVEFGGAEPEGVEAGGAESEGAESGGAEPGGVASSGGSAGASLKLSPQQLHEWLVRCARRGTGAARAGGTGDSGAGGAGVPAGAGGTEGATAAGPGAARTAGTGAAGTGSVGDAGARDPTEPGAAGA
ncbi:unnamed protein product [Closterium sp. NIES-54]